MMARSSAGSERRILIPQVAGSNPAAPANEETRFIFAVKTECMRMFEKQRCHYPDCGCKDIPQFVLQRDSRTKRGRGRPRITERRPWEIAGISKRTYYRRQAKGKTE